MEYIPWLSFILMSIVALWYKVRAERAEEWVYFIQSEIERLIEEDEQSEA